MSRVQDWRQWANMCLMKRANSPGCSRTPPTCFSRHWRQCPPVPGDGPLTSPRPAKPFHRSEEHTSELQSRGHLVCRLLLEKKKIKQITNSTVTSHNGIEHTQVFSI